MIQGFKSGIPIASGSVTVPDFLDSTSAVRDSSRFIATLNGFSFLRRFAVLLK